MVRRKLFRGVELDPPPDQIKANRLTILLGICKSIFPRAVRAKKSESKSITKADFVNAMKEAVSLNRDASSLIRKLGSFAINESTIISDLLKYLHVQGRANQLEIEAFIEDDVREILSVSSDLSTTPLQAEASKPSIAVVPEGLHRAG